MKKKSMHNNDHYFQLNIGIDKLTNGQILAQLIANLSLFTLGTEVTVPMLLGPNWYFIQKNRRRQISRLFKIGVAQKEIKGAWIINGRKLSNCILYKII